MTVCPHCRAEGPFERDRVVRWRCARCGAPVVPTGDLKRANAELPELVRVHRARAMAFGWSAASWVFFAIAVGTLTLGVALLRAAAPLAGTVFLVLGGLAMVLSLALNGRGVRHKVTLETQLEVAWYKAAGEVLAARGAMSATALAEQMQTDEKHATKILKAVAGSAS